jgi:hypothetical protein
MGMTRIDETMVQDEDGNQYFWPLTLPNAANRAGEPGDMGNGLMSPDTSDAPPWWVAQPKPPVPDSASVTAGGVEPGVVKEPTGLYAKMAQMGSMGRNAEDPVAMRPPPVADRFDYGTMGTKVDDGLGPLPAMAPTGPAPEPEPVLPPPPLESQGVPSTREEVLSRAVGVANQKDMANRAVADSQLAEGAVREEDALRRQKEAEQFARDWSARAAETQKRIDDRMNDWRKRNEEASNTKVDPNGHWSRRGGLGSVMTLLGVALGALVEHKYGKNTALEIVREQIAQDIAAQETNINNKLKGLANEKDAIAELGRSDEKKLENFATDYNLRLKAIDHALDAKLAGLTPGKTRANYELAKTVVQEEIFNTEAKLYEQLKGEEQAKLARQHASAMQGASQRAQAAENQKNRDHAMELERLRQAGDMEKLNASAKLKPGEAPIVVGGNKASGLRFVGPNGEQGEGFPVLSDEAAKRVPEIATAATKKFNALRAVQTALQDTSKFDRTLGDTELSAAVMKAAMDAARTYGGPITQSDAESAMLELYGAAKVTGASGLLNSMKPGDINNVVDKQLSNLKLETEAQLSYYSRPGFTPVFNPPDTISKKAAARSPEDAVNALGGQLGVEGGMTDDPRRLPSEEISPAMRVLERMRNKAPKTGDHEWVVNDAKAAVEAALKEGRGPEFFDEMEAVISMGGEDPRHPKNLRDDVGREAKQQALLEIRMGRMAAARRAKVQELEARAQDPNLSWAERQKAGYQALQMKVE